MPKRDGNNPKRRIEPVQRVDWDHMAWLKQNARYAGSAHHKGTPADYRFNPPTSPRPSKSLCEAASSVLLAEAQELFLKGIDLGMVSTYREGDYPKYIWAVDEDEDTTVYEAVISKGSNTYHGYALGADNRFIRIRVINEWNSRCQTS